jgi:hypothetical protein
MQSALSCGCTVLLTASVAVLTSTGLDMETVEKSLIEFGENCLKNGTRYRCML